MKTARWRMQSAYDEDEEGDEDDPSSGSGSGSDDDDDSSYMPDLFERGTLLQAIGGYRAKTPRQKFEEFLEKISTRKSKVFKITDDDVLDYNLFAVTTASTVATASTVTEQQQQQQEQQLLEQAREQEEQQQLQQVPLPLHQELVEAVPLSAAGSLISFSILLSSRPYFDPSMQRFLLLGSLTSSLS
jgi:hypothetical protein